MNIYSAWQWFRKIEPWTAMVYYTGALVAYGIYYYGITQTLPLVLTVISAGVALDFFLHKLQKTFRSGDFPKSGLISSFIVILLTPPGANIFLAAATVTLAILSKHFIRLKNKHVANPAAFGVVAIFLASGTGVRWWGDAYPWLVVALGVFNLWRVRKYWQFTPYLAVFVGFIALASWPNVPDAAGLFSRLPWFFMMFMLPEPVTSLRGRWQEIAFGTTAAITAIAFTYLPFRTEPILFGLLSANLLRYLVIK